MRKRTKRKVWPLRTDTLQYAMAGAAIVDDTKLTEQRLHELTALEAFKEGSATMEDWNELTGMVLASDTMGEVGIGPEAREVCGKAWPVLRDVFNGAESGIFPMAPAQLLALQEVYEIYCAQRTAVAASAYEAALRVAMRRASAGRYPLADIVKGYRG